MQLHLDEQLSSLRLGGMKQALSQQQAQSALYLEMGFEERLQLLLEHELMQREQRKINRLEKQARFRLSGQIEQLDYRASRGISKGQIRQLLEGQWLAHQQNLLLTGRRDAGRVTWPVRWAGTLSGKG
jgi:DNA replication protein DnaC